MRRKRGVAHDVIGWRPEDFIDLASNISAKAYAGMVDAFQLIEEGAVEDDPELLRMLRHSRGHALLKPASFRPAGSVLWWMQIPSSMYINRNAEAIRGKVGPGNVAVGVRGGCEALSWSSRMLLEQHPDYVGLKTDVVAAFPSVARRALMEAEALINGLSGNIKAHYGGDNELSFIAENGDIYTICIKEGGNTGCAKLPALFSIAAQKVLEAVRRDHPDVTIMGTMDDNYLIT